MGDTGARIVEPKADRIMDGNSPREYRLSCWLRQGGFGGTMRLTIANISKSIPTADFRTTVRAIARQVREDFSDEWGVTATLRATALSLKGDVPVDGKHDAIIYVGDASQDPTTGVEGALGYHSRNHGSIPYGFIYLDICAEYGELWTTTLSHEVLELLGDPTAALTVTGPAPKGHKGSVYYDLEVCDPTQGDSYKIDGVEVSNFVGKSYFGLVGGSGHTNFLELPLKPFGVRPKGYFQYEDKKGVHQVMGEIITEKQLAARKLMKLGRRNARRAAREISDS
jgi:hypothetical protein